MCRLDQCIEKLESIQFTKSDVLCPVAKRRMPRLLDKLIAEIRIEREGGASEK